LICDSYALYLNRNRARENSDFRLEAYDRNSDFGGGERVEREYSMKVPNHGNYKDINKDTVITRIREEAVIAYLGKMNKESRFLKYVRLACEDDIYLVRAGCIAQMKKSNSYRFDASVDVDGCIAECQWECDVGMEPAAACKHVYAVLLALQKICKKRDIITEDTCTQNLQTFHHAKPYKGSPIKAKDLSLANDVHVNYDPRPLEFQNRAEYQDTYNNVWLNHSCVNSMPISHLFPTANTIGVEADHDYLPDTSSETWLKV
jgi:hypothetical protein